MPFTEHRGGGKASANVTSMQKRWDAEWQSCTGAGIPDLTSSENWPWVREYIRPPARVLEAGCGFARWVAFLNAQGYEAYGLDYSPVAVERSLAAWPKLRLTVGDLRRLPYEDGFFDGIVSFGASSTIRTDRRPRWRKCTACCAAGARCSAPCPA